MVGKTLNIIDAIKRVTIGDGHSDIIVDLEESHDVYIVDTVTGDEYLDFFSMFASAPLGYNHPKMLEDVEFLRNLRAASLNKITNSDLYTEQMAEFVETFERIAMRDRFKHTFFISGGALAVENALKASFDWKVRKNFEKGYEGEQGSKVLHFEQAFHGRTGYTLSLTNTTDPRKYEYFPKFNWPRVSNPKIKFPLDEHIEEVEEREEKTIEEINDAFAKNKDDIAAIIIEPIQGEGGDNHFRSEFLRDLRDIADEKEAMLIYDEVQTGVGLTGEFWAYEHFKGAEPDMVAFGKKMQVCGFMSTDRIDEVENNVFKESSRINSTWGGNIVDMVRASKYLKIMEEDNILKKVKKQSKYLMKKLEALQQDHEDTITNVRGLGMFAAFDLPSKDARDNFKKEMHKRKIMLLGCGAKSIRLRPPLIIENEHIDILVENIEDVLNVNE